MDRQEYLNKISSSGRPQQISTKQRPAFLSSTIFKIAVASLALIIVLSIAGSILNSSKDKAKNDLYSFKLHIDEIVKVINDNKKYLKSSTLRSNTVSLTSILVNTSSQYTTVLTNEYGYSDDSITEKMQSEEDEAMEELEDELFDAKINNLFDSTFSRKMIYEISLIQSKEQEIIESTNSSDMKAVLEDSYNSLENIYNNFYNFSDSSN